MRILSLCFLYLLLNLSFIPASSANVTFDFPTGGNCFPFGGCPPSNTNIEYQQVYSRYIFGAEPLEITGISFKPEFEKSFGPTPIEFTLTLSTTQTQAGNIAGDPLNKPITTSFSENLGTNTVVVFSGTAIFSSSGQNVFDINLPFTTPYIYDPSMGNLIVGVSNINGGIPFTGFAAGDSNLVSRYYNNILGEAPNIDVQGGYGLATQFVSLSDPIPVPFPVTPVPEPETYGMLLAGLGLIGFVSRRRIKKY